MVDRAREAHGREPRELDQEMPDGIAQAETVGLIYDEMEGLSFLVDFGLVQEAFADPYLLAGRRHHELVLDYLQDDGVSPVVLRRLALRDLDRADQVFQRILERPGFSWERDSELLLRHYKAEVYEQSPFPRVTPISSKLANEIAADPIPAKMTPGRGSPGRNDPCPCGSGKKYKRCCGGMG